MSIKISARFPLEVRIAMVKWLQDSFNLFSISPHELPNIDPTLVGYQLNAEDIGHYVSQYWRGKSPEKAETITRTVRGMLDAKFISKAKYT